MTLLECWSEPGVMNSPAARSSNVTMKKYRYVFLLALVACSSSTTVVYQVLPDAGGTDAGAVPDGSVFGNEEHDSGSTPDTGVVEDAGADVADGAWIDASFDAWVKDTSFDSADGS